MFKVRHTHIETPKQSVCVGGIVYLVDRRTYRPSCSQSNQHSGFSLPGYSNFNLLQMFGVQESTTGSINMVMRKMLTNSSNKAVQSNAITKSKGQQLLIKNLDRLVLITRGEEGRKGGNFTQDYFNLQVRTTERAAE